MQKENEVWKVSIQSKEYNEHKEYYVFATSAATAEKKALKLSKNDDVEKPYCSGAVIYCIVDA